MGHVAEANGVVVEQERLVDGGGLDGDLLVHRCRVEARGALVVLSEIGWIEAEVGTDRGSEALSRARNRVFGGNPHREIRDRAPRNAAWSRCQPVGGLRDVHDDDQGLRLPCRCRRPGRPGSAYGAHSRKPGRCTARCWSGSCGDGAGVPVARRWGMRPVTTSDAPPGAANR